jgi:demethylmenaquinone methyltransferase/2-methoxy-6-polyprenyl-1,4-benzoquinol methylase
MKMLTPETTALLEEQKAYYEARAAEYDEWWERRGRYDLGPRRNAAWKQEIRLVEEAFNRAPLEGRVLEPAAGTGYWTEYFARRAEHVNVVDASQAMLRANKKRLERAGLVDRVTYYQADLLDWRSDQEYDTIFLAFWLSHLPSSLVDTFLSSMASMLRREGVLVILEGLHTIENTALPELRQQKQGSFRLNDEIEQRILNDGRTFRIIKRYDPPDVWATRLRKVHLDPQIGTSGEQFFYAMASNVMRSADRLGHNG